MKYVVKNYNWNLMESIPNAADDAIEKNGAGKW